MADDAGDDPVEEDGPELLEEQCTALSTMSAAQPRAAARRTKENGMVARLRGAGIACRKASRKGSFYR
jgi:hypothetical protein